MDDIQRELDTHTAVWGRQNQRRPISCTTCTQHGCCKQKVMISFYEGILIADHLRKSGRDGAKLRKRLRTESKRQDSQSRKSWFRQDGPCVFHRDGNCSVYEVRPVVCRALYVNSPPSNCEPDAQDEATPVPVLDHVDAHSFGVEFTHAMGLNPDRAHFDILPRVVYRMLRAADSKTWGHWSKCVNKQAWPKSVEAAERMLDGGTR